MARSQVHGAEARSSPPPNASLPIRPFRIIPPERALIWAGLMLLAVFAVFAAIVAAGVSRAAHRDFLAFSDFFAQRSFGQFARFGDVRRIYDSDALHQFQLTIEPELRRTFPYPYPPGYLFAVWPLSLLPFGGAYFLWDGVSLALFLGAVFGTRLRTWYTQPPKESGYTARGVGVAARAKRRRYPEFGEGWVYVWFVLLAPATILCLAAGQSGLLTSALLVGGLRLLRDRPLTGGALLGLATIKPQLGVMVPLALLAARQWRALAAAVGAAILLAAASGLVFGFGLWLDWWNGLAAHAAFVDDSLNGYLKPSVMGNLRLFGVGEAAAWAVQAAIAAAVAAIVVWCCRRGVTDPAIAVLQTGTLLAMPFVFRYDLPMLANAALLLVRGRERTRQPVGLIEAAVIALGLLAPAINTLTTRFFWLSGLSLALLFGLAVWRWRAAEAVRG